MEQAIERVSKSIRDYRNGSLTRSLATIELVSAFKVVCNKAGSDPERLQASVAQFVEGLLERLDQGQSDEEQIVAKLAQVYEAAFKNDPKIAEYLGG